MNKKRTGNTGSCSINSDGLSCCRVESLVSVDERGQMVLPKDLRERAGIRPGDKLALVSWDKNGTMCCIAMVKADDLASLVRGMLGPVLDGLNEQRK